MRNIKKLKILLYLTALCFLFASCKENSAGGANEKQLDSNSITTEDTKEETSKIESEETHIMEESEESAALESEIFQETKGQAVESNTESKETEYTGVDDEVIELISSMTLEEKVGQLLYVNLNALNEGVSASLINSTIENNLMKYQPGGVILFEENMKSDQQTQKLLSYLNSALDIPLFLGVDEEGGIVQRIGRNRGMSAEYVEPMRDIGDSGDPDRAYQVGIRLGDTLNNLGFNMDFAPVADVLTNEQNTEIGTRSFGNDPLIVSQMVSEAVRGFKDKGIISVLKHFPGHGNSGSDTHNGLSEVDTTLEELRECELLPFKAGIEAGAESVLVSHLSLPKVSGEGVPSSLSYEIVTKLLREELGFDGLIITDALNMGAISNSYTSREACVAALEAGVDVLLMPSDLEGAYQGILSAIEDGRLSEARIDESVYRILRLKISQLNLKPDMY